MHSAMQCLVAILQALWSTTNAKICKLVGWGGDCHPLHRPLGPASSSEQRLW
jgi:hypothetical protein